MLDYTTQSFIKRLLCKYSDPADLEESLTFSNLPHDDIETMIHGVIHVFDDLLTQKQLSFKVQMPVKTYEGLMVPWDKYELVLFQLVSNAVKYSDAGGQLEVTLSISKELLGRTVLKTKVIDTGAGIQER